jgi:glutamyl/glutaminyl-tRNA synthetase
MPKPSGHHQRGHREEGYLPEALVVPGFLGWNGTQQEIFSMGRLIQAFSIERVSKS